MQQKVQKVQGKKKKNWPQIDFPIVVVIWWLLGWKESNSNCSCNSMGFKSKGRQLNVLMGKKPFAWKIIRSTKRTTDVVLLNLPTNKMLLFKQMWHHLIIFIFYSLCWLGSSLTHLHKWHYLIGWEDHISSSLGGSNNFLFVWYGSQRERERECDCWI